jgi:membrane protein
MPENPVQDKTGIDRLAQDRSTAGPDARMPQRRWKRVVGLLKETVIAFGDDECSLRAAALAYHSLLSLFPLLLFLVFLGGAVLSSGNSLQTIQDYVTRISPQLAQTVNPVIAQTTRARGPIGLIGGAWLLWSASAIFTVLSSTFNVIWDARPRPFILRRLVGLIAVILTVTLFVFSLLSRTLAAFALPPHSPLADRLLNPGLDFVATVLICWLLYTLLPNQAVHVPSALFGAVLAAVVWQAAKAGFSFYLTSGLTRLGLVYGSLASVVVLVLWVYVSSLILFLGAEFAATLGAGALADQGQLTGPGL